MSARREALQEVRDAERELAASRGEQYAQVFDIGPRWDAGHPCRT